MRRGAGACPRGSPLRWHLPGRVSPGCVARLGPRVTPELPAPLAPAGPELCSLRWRCLCTTAMPLGFCLAKMAAALLLLRRRRRLRALGRRRRPLSLTERRGAGTRGAMAGGRRGAMARPEQSNSAPPPGARNPNPQTLSGVLRRHLCLALEAAPRHRPPTKNPQGPLLHRFVPCSTGRVWR